MKRTSGRYGDNGGGVGAVSVAYRGSGGRYDWRRTGE